MNFPKSNVPAVPPTPFAMPRGYYNEQRVRDILASNLNSLSYGGINMEVADHGEPTSSKVQKNPEKTDMDAPQAWFLNGRWLYNYIGSLEEATEVAKARGKILEKVWPTEQQQLQFFAAMPGNAVAKNKIMNGGIDQFTGYRHPGDGNLVNTNNVSGWWSAASQKIDTAHNIWLDRGDRGAYAVSDGRDFAFSLRFLSDKA